MPGLRMFSHRKTVSGVIDTNGNLLVCFEKSQIKGVGIHPLIFNDTNGNWTFNFWYSETSPQNQHSHTMIGKGEYMSGIL